MCSDLLIVYDVVDANWLQSVTFGEMIGSCKKELVLANERKSDVFILC